MLLTEQRDRRHCGGTSANFFSLLDLLSHYELTSRKSTSVSSVFVCPESSSVHWVSDSWTALHLASWVVSWLVNRLVGQAGWLDVWLAVLMEGWMGGRNAKRLWGFGRELSETGSWEGEGGKGEKGVPGVGIKRKTHPIKTELLCEIMNWRWVQDINKWEGQQSSGHREKRAGGL